MVKHVLAIIIGTITGMICIVFMQIGIFHLHPVPAGTDLYDSDSVEKAMSVMPQEVFIQFLVSYMIASFIAGITATLISRRIFRTPVLATGVIMTIAGIIKVTSVHQPLWFSVTSCFLYFPFAYLGYLVTRKKQDRPE